MRSGRSLLAAALAAALLLLLGGETASAQLRVGPEVDLRDGGPGSAPVLSYDGQRHGWVAFWPDVTDRLVSRYIGPDLRPKHDSNTQFGAGRPVTAAYDPVADEHVLATFAGRTTRVWRFSPTGALNGGPWSLEAESVLGAVGLDPRTGAGIVAYVAERDGPDDDDFPDDDPGLWIQRLAPGGGPQGAPLRLSDVGALVSTYRPAVTFNPARGEFAVAWRQSRSLTGDIVARRVAASSGDPVGAPVAVSDSRGSIATQLPPGDPEGAGAPALVYDPRTAGYFASWTAARGDVLEGPTQVYGQRLDADLNQVGADDFRISAGPGNVYPQSAPVAVANDGIVVAWWRWADEQLQIVGRRLAVDAPAAPDVLWTADGLYSGSSLAGPASGPLLLAAGIDLYPKPDHPQVRLVGDGPDPGTARITSAPPDTASSADAAFTLDAGSAAIQCRLDEGAWQACQPNHTESGVSDGPHRLQARAVGAGGWVQPVPAAAGWRVEATPPDTRITEAPPANDAFPTFSFASDEPGTTECRVDDGTWSACSAFYRANVSDGVHRFEVRAIDDSGRRDPTPALWIWTKDTVAPDTTAADGPTGDMPRPGTYWFESNDPTAHFECASDVNSRPGPFSPCTSGAPFPTSSTTLWVRAVDDAGNADASPARWHWSPDISTPKFTFESFRRDMPDDGVYTTRDLDVPFGVGETGSGTYVPECRVDGGAWERCNSPLRLEGLAEGPHVLQGRATSRAGILGPVDEVRFTVDAQRPATFIIAKPRSRTLLRDARIEFGATAPATFTCVVDGGAPQPCTSPLAVNGLAPGFHSVKLRATGTGGWSEPLQSSVDWKVETDPNAPPSSARSALARRSAAAAGVVPPDTWLFGTPDKQSRSSEATFEWEADDDDGDDQIAGSECRLDGSDWTPCESPLQYRGLAEGQHTFSVRAVDVDGNRDPSPESYSWTIDTVTPRVLIQSAPPWRTNASVVTVAFSADRDTATLECRFADTTFQPCTSPYTATDQPEGAYRLIIRAVNKGAISPVWSVSWNIDRTPPDTSLSADRVSNGMTTTSTELGFEVHKTGQVGDEFDGEVLDEAMLEECRLDGGPWQQCGSPIRNLADGTHVLEARVTDQAGNTDPTPARLRWSVDTRSHDTVIDSGPAATVDTHSPSFTLRSIPAGDGFECRLDGGAWRTCGANYTLAGVPDGSHTLEARATGGPTPDATPARWLWTSDAEPTPVVLSGPSARATVSTATFHLGVDDASATLECKLDDGAFAACSADPSFAGLADGAHALSVRARDGGGRTGVLGDPWRWTIDTQAPDSEITAAPEPLRRWHDADFAFRTGDPDARLQCRLDSGAWAACSSPYRLGGNGDGTHTLAVRAIDAFGNIDPTPATATWRVDTTGPVVSLSPPPPDGTKSTSMTLSATANEPVGTIECRVDDRAWTPCRDPAVFSGLAEGPHRAEARAQDSAGNVGYRTGWSRTIGRAVDTEIVRRPRAVEDTTRAVFEFAGDRSVLRCSLDGAAWASCASPTTYSVSSEGHHVFQVAAVDGDGDLDPTPARWEWDVDLRPIDTSISYAATPGDPRTATFFLGSTQGLGSTFRCQLDGGAMGACGQKVVYTGLADGPHRFVAVATGPTGDVDSTPAVYDWTVAAAAPAAAAARAPQVARTAAETVGRALKGTRWRAVLAGKRRLRIAGAPRMLIVRVRAHGRLVASARVRMTAAGKRRVALHAHGALRPGARATVSATWHPARGDAQRWTLKARVRRR
jgi:hypothetical protein